MNLQSTAQDTQELFVIDPISPASQLPADDNSAHDHPDLVAIPVEMPEELEAFEDQDQDQGSNEPCEVEITIEEIPGAPGSPDPEPMIELSEEHVHVKEEGSDADDKKSKKSKGKWDWEAREPTEFVAWVKERLDDVPKHNGQEESGIERAVSYLEKLDNEVSKAMRLDLDGDLDANKVEEIRSKIDEGIERLHSRLDKVKQSRKSHRKKKSDLQYEIVKEAQKAAGIHGIVITVPLLISRIARVCINGTISAGHDTRDIFQREVKKYKLNMREQAELIQLLEDMNFPIREDRGFMPDEDLEVTDSNNFDWMANYPA